MYTNELISDNKFLELISLLNSKKQLENFQLIIQTHDYPDPDAIASGFALSYLLKTKGFSPKLVYNGKIQSFSIESAIVEFGVEIFKYNDVEIRENTFIILVDCYITNKNITTSNDNVIGLVDHHRTNNKGIVKFEDVRSNYGSSSTIIYSYFISNNIDMPINIASALLMGMIIDTSYLTRGIDNMDFEAYFYLYKNSNANKVLEILKNSMSVSYLNIFKEAIENFDINNELCFIPIRHKNVIPEILAIIADFFIGLKEIKFVVILGNSDENYRISVRSFSINYPASTIISKSLENIGYGGGHYHMGGGIIFKDKFIGEENLKKKFLEVYNSYRV